MGLLENDPALASEMQTYAKMMPQKKRPSLNKIAKHLQKNRKTWSVRQGDRAGEPWPAKQISTFLQKFDQKRQ